MPRMTITDFEASLEAESPPADLDSCVEALWYAAKGDWDRAHQLAQSRHDSDGAWVHGHLHRIEGDLGNASYWYRRAGRAMGEGDFAGERRAILSELLGES